MTAGTRVRVKARIMGQSVEYSPAKSIIVSVQGARDGEEKVAALFRRAGAALGLAVADLVNLLNPPRVILTGEGLRAGALLNEPLLAAVAANVLPSLREGTEILFHGWGDDMWARGAATIVLRRIYEAPWNATAWDRPGAEEPALSSPSPSA
jgi:predicted NBD/HSP70 family sugar kinase